MDPLSVGASVIAVVGATGKVVKGIRRLKGLQNAPKELDDLLAEVSQFELVVTAMQKLDENKGSELGALLRTAQEILVEFESLIEYELTEAGTSNKVDRWSWTRNFKNVERLRDKLRNVTANMVALVGVNTSMTLDHMRSEHQQFSNQMLPMFAQLVELLEGSPATQAALNGTLGNNVRRLTLGTVSQINEPVAENIEHQALQVDQTTPNLRPQDTLIITRTQKVAICTRGCTCKCHSFKEIGGPSFLSNVFGHGYLQTAGSFFRKTQCDTVYCKAQNAPCVSVQYCLPQWLASRMIDIWLRSSPPCSPEVLLRVPRVVGQQNVAFQAIINRDTGALSYAIAKGDCRPDDVSERGWTLFNFAFRLRYWDGLAYLSSCSDFWDLSTFEPWMMKNVLTDLLTSPKMSGQSRGRLLRKVLMKQSSPLTSWEQAMETHAFTTLHQIVCGLSSASFDVEIQLSSDLDALDKCNRSALYYAVMHGKLDYVRKLLEIGADPNIGESPLWAIEPAGFDRFAKALQESSFTGLLTKHGVDFNKRNYRGKTVLMNLAENTYKRDLTHLKWLIGLGADTEIADKNGMTALMYAVRAGSADAFSIIAGAGARIDMKTAKGSTVLHLAVTQLKAFELFGGSGLCELCAVMRGADLTGLHLNAQDEDGNTAFDLLRKRNAPYWKDYCKSKYIYMYWIYPCSGRMLEEEVEAISALEQLLHHVQEIQGVPEADRYPPLGEHCARIVEEEPVPGAWPVY